MQEKEIVSIYLWSNIWNFKPYSLFMRKLDSCWHELSKTKLELWRWIVSSRHTLMLAANSHPYSPISQQLAVLRSGKWGGWSGCSKKNMITQSYGSWCSALWLLVVCQQIQRQRRTKQQDWDLSLGICLISVLFCKIIFFGMAPKITSSCKQERWVSQHVPTTMYILRTWKC